MFCYLLSAGWQFFCWIVLSAIFTTGLCSVIYHRWGQNVVKTKQMAHEAWSSVSLKYLPHIEVFCDLFLYSDMEFICFLWWQSKSLLMVRPSMHLFSNKSWTMSKNQSKYLHNSAYYIISNNAQSMYLFREVCHTEFHKLPDVIKNRIFFLVCLVLLLVVFFFLFFLLIFCH